MDFDRPEAEGLRGAVNLYLDTPDGAKIGLWHVVPESMVEEAEGKPRDWYELQLSGGRPVVIYMHGNTGSRAREHRIAMYQVLRRLGYHVVCFDYRGYADSSRVVPTKCGVITDGHAVYEYVQSLVGDSPLFVWGHSLGTGVSSAVLADICQRGEAEGKKLPKALVLESPFNNIRDEVRNLMTSICAFMHSPIVLPTADSRPSHDVPVAQDALLRVVLHRDAEQERRRIPHGRSGAKHSPPHSHVSLKGACSQTLCITRLDSLHLRTSQDDVVIPFQLGKKLYEVICESRKQNSTKQQPVKFVEFSEDQGYGHINIYSAPELPDIVDEFFRSAADGKWEESRLSTKEV